jgi:hypothetical protein
LWRFEYFGKSLIGSEKKAKFISTKNQKRKIQKCQKTPNGGGGEINSKCQERK